MFVVRHSPRIGTTDSLQNGVGILQSLLLTASSFLMGSCCSFPRYAPSYPRSESKIGHSLRKRIRHQTKMYAPLFRFSNPNLPVLISLSDLHLLVCVYVCLLAVLCSTLPLYVIRCPLDSFWRLALHFPNSLLLWFMDFALFIFVVLFFAPSLFVDGILFLLYSLFFLLSHSIRVYAHSPVYLCSPLNLFSRRFVYLFAPSVFGRLQSQHTPCVFLEKDFIDESLSLYSTQEHLVFCLYRSSSLSLSLSLFLYF